MIKIKYVYVTYHHYVFVVSYSKTTRKNKN